MALTCPRCETNVPDEALYCPYCNLPKPRAGFVDEEMKEPEGPKTADEPRSPVAFRKTNPMPERSLRRRPNKPPRKFRLPVLVATALVSMIGVGVYIYVVPMVLSSQAVEPKSALSALDKLRRMPSNEPNLTIDARMARELERSRRVGNLVSYQGWSTQKINGTKTKVLLIFSYQEVGDVHHRAEWLADLANNTFTPQTELAVLVSNQAKE